MEHPKVSILIPCYNSERFIAETLKSCIEQDYDNVEIIVVDDGSSDKSFAIAREWATRYSSISVYCQPNKGVCRARNLAFEKSSGEYIMYLDADDIISRDKISHQIKLLSGESFDTIATCKWDRFYSDISDATFPELIVYRDYNNSLELIEDLLNGGMLGVSCYLTHRSIIEKAGMWNEKLIINTDGEYFFRVLANAGKIIYCRQGALYYRSSVTNSISRRKPTAEKGESLLLSYILTYKYLAEHGMLTLRAKQGLARAFQSVAYQYCSYSDIVLAACQQIDRLHVKRLPVFIGGRTFRILCRLLGFWNMLKIKSLIRAKLSA